MKILHKKDFTINDADILFTTNAKRTRRDSIITNKNYINFNIFRFFLLPEIATRRDIPLDKLIYRISIMDITPTMQSQSVTPNSSRPSSSYSNDNPQFLQTSYSAAAVSALTSEMNGNDEIEDIHRNRAALRVQSKIRQQLSMKNLKVLKEVEELKSKISESNTQIDNPLTKQQEESEDEIKLQGLYRLYTDIPGWEGEMDIKSFVRMCEEHNLTDIKKFTRKDAAKLFTICKERALLPSSPSDIREGVILEKRIKYNVFRRCCLRELAEKKGVPVCDIIAMLLSEIIIDPPCNYTTEDEIALRNLFMNFTKNKTVTGQTQHIGEMSCEEFVNMCRESEILDKKTLTEKDAIIVFQQAISRARMQSSPPEIKSGVTQDLKKGQFVAYFMNYQVFRRVAIRVIAEKRGKTVDNIIELFL